MEQFYYKTKEGVKVSAVAIKEEGYTEITREEYEKLLPEVIASAKVAIQEIMAPQLAIRQTVSDEAIATLNTEIGAVATEALLKLLNR